MIRTSRIFLGSIFVLLLASLATAQTERVRIMAANTSSGNFQSYLDPGKRIFQGLKPDIVLIQEFKIGATGSTSTADTNAFVAEAFGPEFSWFREPASGGIPNGIISRYPIIAAGEWVDTNVSDRDFAWARIDIPGDKHLTVVSIHFLTSSATNRNAQATLLRSYVNANVDPNDYLVIGGDFNTNSRTESAINTLSTLVTDAAVPVDQDGNGNTNANRNRPYDMVLPGFSLHALRTSVIIGQSTYPNGLVFDSRVYTPLSEVAPVQQGDSGVSGMQHMAVVKDFLIPTGSGTSTPTPTPSSTGPTPTATATPVPGIAEVFINEIHYDNVNADVDEGIEVAGPAGFNLTGWQLIHYDGSGGGVVDTVPLSGLIPDQQGCMGAIWFPIPGLQNGAPDGVALINGQGAVVQFLSWEGTFAATAGPAQGVTSVDIGVEQTNSTPIGQTLQLQGTGSRYADFTWSQPVTQTRGQVNTGQTFSGCAPTPTVTATPTPGGIGEGLQIF